MHYHVQDAAGRHVAIWCTFAMCGPDLRPGYRIVSCARPVYQCTYRTLTPDDIRRIDSRLGLARPRTYRGEHPR
jgi:hypothetical protein